MLSFHFHPVFRQFPGVIVLFYDIKSFVKCVDWFYHSLTLVLRLPLSALRGDSPVLFREPREHVSEKLMCSRVLATYGSFPVSLMCFCFTLILCKKKSQFKRMNAVIFCESLQPEGPTRFERFSHMRLGADGCDSMDVDVLIT